MTRLARWLPLGTGLIAYLGVAPFSCDWSPTWLGRLSQASFPGENGCSGVLAWNGSTHFRALALGIVVGLVTLFVSWVATRWRDAGPVARSTVRVLLLGVTLLSFISYAGLMAATFPLSGPSIVLMIRVSTRVGAVLWAIVGILAAYLAASLYVWLFPTGLPLLGTLFMCVVFAIAMLGATTARFTTARERF